MTEHRRAVDTTTPTKAAGPMDRLGHVLKAEGDGPVIPDVRLSDLESRGIDVSGVRVMSGFRTPQYNKGGGNTGGRAGLSRHMYGDAADVFIDSNGDGVMDDLNRDGRVNIGDSRVVSQAVDRVEKAHPELVGGAGVYPAASGHGPFIHIDTRGYRARWTGSGGG